MSEGAAELAGKADGLPNPLDVETPAAQWAKQRSAWMVGMKWVDGILQENPNATYRLDDVMRDALRSKVSQAVEGGWTSVKLAESIRAHEAFSVARANNIARTEIAEAQQEGSMVYYRASGVVDRKIWSTARGGDTCPRCKSAEAEGPIPLEATFVSTGTQHAPGHSHCVPEGSRVLWGGRVVGATKALYSGPVVEFGTDLGHLAAVTVNHPVLTARGWIPAHALSEGDYLVSPNFGERMPDADPDNKQLETMIEDAFASCVVSSLMTPKSVVVSPEDFHGDAKGFQGDVEIVNPDGLLLSDVHPSGADEVSQNILTLVGEGLGLLARDSEILGHFVRALLSSDLSVERANELASSLWSESVKADLVRLRNSSALNALLYKDSRDYVAADSKLLGDLLFWLSRHVSAANVISVEVRDFIGHVYDLQVTSGSMYTCNGIYIHNCRCVALPVLKEETA